jgi:hypothetical protein
MLGVGVMISFTRRAIALAPAIAISEGRQKARE